MAGNLALMADTWASMVLWFACSGLHLSLNGCEASSSIPSPIVAVAWLSSPTVAQSSLLDFFCYTSVWFHEVVMFTHSVEFGLVPCSFHNIGHCSSIWKVITPLCRKGTMSIANGFLFGASLMFFLPATVWPHSGSVGTE